MNKIVDSVVANANAVTSSLVPVLSLYKYCTNAPKKIQIDEKINAFAGTNALDNFPNNLGACLSVDRPNNIRLVENTPLFIEDITDESTTRFIIIAADAMPACEKIFTNGLTLGLI